MAILRETGNLAKSQFPFQKPDSLIMQQVFYRSAVESSLSQNEALLGDLANAAFTIGKDVKIHGQQLAKELWTPSATIEDNRDTPIGSDEFANLLQDRHQHFGHRIIGIRGNHKEWIPGSIINPVIGGRGNCEACACIISLGNCVFPMIGAH